MGWLADPQYSGKEVSMETLGRNSPPGDKLGKKGVEKKGIKAVGGSGPV